jgi:uncharacterized protein YggE
MKFFATSMALVFVSVSTTLAEPELRGSPTELTQYLKDIPKTVSVVGTAEVKVQADRAVVSLSVRTEDKLLATALRNNQKVRADVMAALEKHGIKTDQIKASQLSQTPKYGWLGDKPKSYIVENTIKVTVHNEKEFQAVATEIDTVSEVRYLGVEFEQTDKMTYKTKALSQACDKATEKKQLLESKFGFKLVPQNMSEGVRVMPAPKAVGYVVSGSYGVAKRTASSSVNSSESIGGEGVDDGGATFGELVYTADVSVEYRVEK